jgi:phenylacetate-CoA ligase
MELRRDQRLDCMTVRVEARADAADEASRAASARELAHRIKSLIGITAEVDALAPGSIERSLGKAKRIVDLRPKD